MHACRQNTNCGVASFNQLSQKTRQSLLDPLKPPDACLLAEHQLWDHTVSNCHVLKLGLHFLSVFPFFLFHLLPLVSQLSETKEQ